MRILANNPWGAQSKNGLDQQRDDLWMLDLTVASKGLDMILDDSRAYAKSVKIPDLDTTYDRFYKETRPYYLPGQDKPVEPVQVVFLYPIPKTGQDYPPIYLLLYKWRARVRSGRGALSDEPMEWLSEANNYGAANQFRWDIPIRLMRGSRPTSDEMMDGTRLVTSSAHILKNAWIASLGITDLDLSNSAKGLEIKASFICEDVLLVPADDIRHT